MQDTPDGRRWRLDCADGLDWLPGLPAESADFICLDPPYGVTHCAWDTPLDLGRLWAGVHHVIKPRGVVAIFAVAPYSADVIASNRKEFRYEMIAVKNRVTGFLNASRRPLRQHENILIFAAEPKHYYQPLMRPGPPRRYSRDCKTTVYGRAGRAEYNSAERHPTTLLEFHVSAREHTGRIHPSEKPVGGLDALVRMYSPPGGLVVDPCAGSAASGVAALRAGRDWIGCELDADYCAAARARLTAEGAPLVLESD